MIALLALIISLVTSHTQYKYQNLVFTLRPTLYIFVITTYFVSRYDILNSIHSFALASKSQHYIEMKLLFLYGVVYFKLQCFDKKHQTTAFLKLNSVIALIFYCYCAYIIIAILYDIFVNALNSLNPTPNGDKFLYLSLLILFCLNLFFKKIPNILFLSLNALILSIFYVQNPTAALTLAVLTVFYNANFNKKYQTKRINYKVGFLHVLLLLLSYLLILYSNVEVFFTNNYYEECFNKNFVALTTQYTSFKNSF
jgi:cytochrome c biogenesis factor